MGWRSFVALAVMVGVFAVGCQDSPTVGTIYEVSSGGATVNGQPAKRDQRIGLKDEVAVISKGAFARIRLQDGTRIFLLPDPGGEPTRFTIDGHREQASAKRLLMRLFKGVATLLVPKDRPKGDLLEVQASYTTTAIRGTEVKIQTGPDGDTVSVKEGTVEVTAHPDKGPAAPQAQTVSTGEQIRFEAAKGFGAKGPYNPFAESEGPLFRDATVPVKATLDLK